MTTQTTTHRHPYIQRFLESAHDARPSRLGQRYSETAFLPEGGNTIVCHLDQTDPAAEAVLAARSKLKALPGADGFLFTPLRSLHMTLFNGALETQREKHFWPEWMPLDAPMAEVTASLLDRLTEFEPGPAFSVRVLDIAPTGLQLSGATDEDERIMRQWRDRLCEPFGYRHPAHDDYAFHMTFAYPVNWLPDTVEPVWHDAYQSILLDLQTKAPVIPLRAPAFCTFDDMTWFEEIMPLG